MFFDTHAHLDDEKYDQDREEMLKRAKNNGIAYICNIGYDLPSSQRSVQLAQKYDFIYAAVGIHPQDAETVNDSTWEEIKKLAQEPKVVAIGEIGLDYYRDLSPREIQRKVFQEQIILAKQLNKPIVVHDREAHGEVMEILTKEKLPEAGGILHCFSGSWEMAQACINMGFYISIAGPVTFNNAKKLKEIVPKLPLERLLIETDSPYLTPEPHRGKRNESTYVVHVAEQIAQLRGMDVEELGNVTTANAKKIYQIKK